MDFRDSYLASEVRAEPTSSTAVMEFINELLGEDPTLAAAELVERVRKRFKLSVHPRSVQRALEREKRG